MAAELVTVHYVLEGFVDISDSVDGLVVGDSELDGAVDRPGRHHSLLLLDVLQLGEGRLC